MIPRAGPRWYIPLPWLPPPPASQMIVQTCWCSQRYKIAMKEKIMLFLFVQNFWFYKILQNIFFQLLYVFSVSFTLSVKIGNFKRPNLFLVHVLRYVAASVLRVLNSYLMRRQRWRDRGEEGVSVTPSPRYSSGCQIIFSQHSIFPYWPRHGRFIESCQIRVARPRSLSAIALAWGDDQEQKLMYHKYPGLVSWHPRKFRTCLVSPAACDYSALVITLLTPFLLRPRRDHKFLSGLTLSRASAQAGSLCHNRH